MNSLLSNIFSPRKDGSAPPETASPATGDPPRTKPKTYSRKSASRGSRASNASEPRSTLDGDASAPNYNAGESAAKDPYQFPDSPAKGGIDGVPGGQGALTPSRIALPGSATKTTPADRGATTTADDADDEQHAFTGFLRHRWSGDDIEIEVEWEGSVPTFEAEAGLQRDAPRAVYEYWRRQGGRPAHPADAGLYTVFAILGHSGDRKRLRVQWTGFGPKEATWEPRRVVEEAAPEMAAEYWAARPERGGPRRGGRGGKGARGGKGGRGRGRGRR